MYCKCFIYSDLISFKNDIRCSTVIPPSPRKAGYREILTFFLVVWANYFGRKIRIYTLKGRGYSVYKPLKTQVNSTLNPKYNQKVIRYDYFPNSTWRSSVDEINRK